MTKSMAVIKIKGTNTLVFIRFFFLFDGACVSLILLEINFLGCLYNNRNCLLFFFTENDRAYFLGSTVYGLYFRVFVIELIQLLLCLVTHEVANMQS